MSWNIEEDDSGVYLMSSSKTRIKRNKRVSFDYVQIMVRLEEASVPLGYTRDLKEINFTYLPGECEGSYRNCQLNICCKTTSLENMEKNVIHELGHHVDYLEGLSDRVDIVREWTRASSSIDDSYSWESPEEYVAVGFEIYYFGSDIEKRKLKKHNSMLFRTINDMHMKYSKTG